MYIPVFRLLSLAICFTLILSSCKKDKSLPSPAITVKNISDTGCTISWTAVSGAGSYELTLALDVSFNTSLLTGYHEVMVNGTSINITTLTPYTKYFVKVIALNGPDNSDPGVTDFMTDDADRLVIVPWQNNKLFAFDGRNGKVKWTFSTAKVYSTPIIQDSIVYVGGADGRLYALNMLTGIEKWKTEATRTGEAFSANALIKNGIVYIGDYGGRCYAYNAIDGSLKWYFDVPSPYADINSTALLDGNTVYFASYDGKIYALDAGTGAYKWATASTGNPILSGMSLVNGVIYVGAIPKVYAFDANTGNTLWVTPAPVYTQYSSSPTVIDNIVFIGGEDGIMYAFNTADGSIAWSKTLGSGSIVSSPVYKEGIIYIGDGNGKMQALQSSTGSIIWINNNLSTKNIYSGPTLSERAVYCGTLDGNVAAMDLQTGTIKWITSISGAIFSASPSVVTYDGKIYYPGLSGDMQ